MMNMLGRRHVLVIGACLVALVTAQFAAGAVAPESGVSSTGRAMGRAGFAYLSGLRTFAAAVLWNRIDPQYHDYYSKLPAADQAFMVPTIRLVVALDPQFAEAYYVSSWVVRKRVGDEAGIELARDGVANNPQSGILRASLVQLLAIQDPNRNSSEILSSVEALLSDGMVWRDDDDLFEGLAVARFAYVSLDMPEEASRIQAVLDRMKEAGVGSGDHDHDGDGEQDH